MKPRRLLPHPLLSVVLLAVWLLLHNSLAPGQVVLGALLAVALPRITQPFWADRPLLRRPRTALRLALRVLWDIVVANIAVARLILGPRSALAPRFVDVPLDIRDPYGIIALASIVTLTPGTVSADLNPERTRLLVHGLRVPDPEALVSGIKLRYERPLMEIFECSTPL